LFRDRNGQAVRGQHRADMCGHVVRTFGVMEISRVTVWSQTRENGLQITAYVDIGILAEDQRCAGMLEEKRTNAFADAAVFEGAPDLCGDVDSAAAVGAKFKRFLFDHEMP